MGGLGSKPWGEGAVYAVLMGWTGASRREVAWFSIRSLGGLVWVSDIVGGVGRME